MQSSQAIGVNTTTQLALSPTRQHLSRLYKLVRQAIGKATLSTKIDYTQTTPNHKEKPL